MRTSLLEKVRQAAHAKAARLDTALAAISVLESDEAELVYARLEQRILAESSVAAKDAAAPVTTERTTRPTTKKVNKSTVTPNKHATRHPSFAERAERFIVEREHGVRTFEVAKAIGQSVPTWRTLKLLERQHRVECRGRRYKALWVPPGIAPEARIEALDAAFLHILAETPIPLGRQALYDAALRLVSLTTGKTPLQDSAKLALGKLIEKGVVVNAGANEYGALYVLASKKGGSVTMN